MELGKAFAFTDLAPEYAAVVIASIGPKDACYNALESLDEARENLRWGIGAGVQLLKKRGISIIEVDPGSAPDAAAEAAELAAWRFQKFKSVTDRKTEVRVTMYGKEGKELWQEGSIFGRGQNWARFLSDMPANKMTPVDLAQGLKADDGKEVAELLLAKPPECFVSYCRVHGNALANYRELRQESSFQRKLLH
ncbi:unnamed protein product [Chrysodeixis includens]|uniref:Uncharacterized protein n=1 Tax=Chrysodeixis includens TaxID=689277 RepID=A0A9N8Q0F1_CHRIL|nr:unnamed protein product [Chrysodeixis includens]